MGEGVRLGSSFTRWKSIQNRWLPPFFLTTTTSERHGLRLDHPLLFHFFHFLVYYCLHGGISGSVSLFNRNHIRRFQAYVVNRMIYWSTYCFKLRDFGGYKFLKASVFVVRGEFIFGGGYDRGLYSWGSGGTGSEPQFCP